MADTKRAILEAALDLFSVDGYDAVSVEKIASAVGIKAPSLYKHYKSKQDIYDSLIEQTTRVYEERSLFNRIHWDDDTQEHPVPDVTAVVQQVKEHLQFALHDPHMYKVRRMLTICQFRSSEMASLQEQHAYTDIMRYHTGLMTFLIRHGVLRDLDPELLALSYTAPISVLIYRVDRDPSCEQQVMTMIEQHIRNFFDTYAVKER